MEFIYKAKDNKNNTKIGKIEARSEDAAIQLLQSYGLVVFDIQASEKGTWMDRLFGAKAKVSLKDLSIFLRQFSTLLSSKVPIMDSLKTLLSEAESSAVKDMIFNLISGLDSGLSLSQAMAHESGVFSSFYVEMVRSGEISGRLEEVFNYLADYAEHEADLNSKAKSASIYPIFIIVVFLLVGSIISTTVAPQMVDIFEEFDKTPPFLTRMLIGFGSFLKNWGLVVAVIIVGLILAIRNYFKTPEGQNLSSYWTMKLPIFGKLYKNIYLSRFTESFSTLLHGGIPVVEAIEVAGSATGNFIFKELSKEIAEGVRRGEPISKLLKNYPEYFPPLVSQMVYVGENTGQLDILLKRVASYYDNEVENTFKVILDLIQPILIIVIGVFVGILIAGVLMPIYQLAQTV